MKLRRKLGFVEKMVTPLEILEARERAEEAKKELEELSIALEDIEQLDSKRVRSRTVQ